MFADVLIALRRCTLIDAVLVVTSDHGAQRIAAGYGAMVLEDEHRATTRRRASASAARSSSAPRGFCWSRATARCWTPPNWTR